jgi:hypothetical protein
MLNSTRIRRIGAGAVGVATLAPLLALTAAPAGATTTSPLPAKYSQYANCPVDTVGLTYCLAASSSSVFTINSTTLDSNGPVLLSLGLIEKKDGTFTAVLPTNGTPALVAQPITVPGGLLGIPGAGVGPLAVTATPVLAGLPQFNLTNLELKTGPTLVLPLQVDLNNPLLGSSCSIGSSADPITVNATDGKTDPPAPNKPIKGALTKLTSDGQGVLTATQKLVDNSFAVPGASGCGPFGILNPIVNYQKNLPSAAGTNATILSGTAGLAPVSVIKKYLG